MDLGAYVQSNQLNDIALKNRINVPRLRGYRLMQNEKPISYLELKKKINEAALIGAERMIEAVPTFALEPKFYVLNNEIKTLKTLYLKYDKDKINVTGVNWNILSDLKKNNMVIGIKRKANDCRKQYNTWNKYCGQKNILYIHARIGSHGWTPGYIEDIIKQPWYLEHIDDFYDPSYCDIYAKIKN